MRFLLDEDLPLKAAVVARGLGLDVRTVQDYNRLSVPDEDQLRFAAGERRVMVTRNRDDFLRLTAEFYSGGEPHGGVLILTARLPNNRPEAIAHALKRWADEYGDITPEQLQYYSYFLS